MSTTAYTRNIEGEDEPGGEERARRKRTRDSVLDSCLRQVRSRGRCRQGVGQRSFPQDSDGHVMDASSSGDLRRGQEQQARRMALKRIIDDALLEEAHVRRKLRAGRRGRASRSVGDADMPACMSAQSMGTPDGASSDAVARWHAREEHEELDQDVHLTEAEYMEMILRLEEELYDDLRRREDHVEAWDEMEDMDAEEIDAMVEAHLGCGRVDGSSGMVVCPVCRQLPLQEHPINPYVFYCPSSLPKEASTMGDPSLNVDTLVSMSHCGLDLSSEGMRLEQVGARVRVCEQAHWKSHPTCGGVVRFEVREGVPGAGEGQRMLVAVCEACGWGEVCV